MQRFDEALEAYKRAIELDPTEVWPWRKKGDSLFRLDRFNEALEAHEHGLAIEPNTLSLWDPKVHVLAKLRRVRDLWNAAGKMRARKAGSRAP